MRNNPRTQVKTDTHLLVDQVAGRNARDSTETTLFVLVCDKTNAQIDDVGSTPVLIWSRL